MWCGCARILANTNGHVWSSICNGYVRIRTDTQHSTTAARKTRLRSVAWKTPRKSRDGLSWIDESQSRGSRDISIDNSYCRKKSLVCSLKYMFASSIHYDVMINDVYPLSSWVYGSMFLMRNRSFRKLSTCRAAKIQIGRNCEKDHDCWDVSSPINGCYHPHPPSPFVIITQSVSPESWYPFYRFTGGGRLSRPRHCSKGAQPMPNAVHRNGYHDKQLAAASHTAVSCATTRPLRPAEAHGCKQLT